VGEVLLKTVGLTKAFGGVTVLKDASVELLAGEMHAFLGENGAGKSTLAKLIAGIHQPTAGHIEIGGQIVSLNSPRAASARGIALIPQEPQTFPDLSAAENIFIGRLPVRQGRVHWKMLYQEAARLLETLGVTIDPRTPARGLSVADRQMLELAGALSQNARVLLLDETTASLTPREVERLAVILHRLKSEGKALVFIGHRMEEIFSLCDRMTVLRDGVIVGERMIAQTDSNELLRLMVGRDIDLLTMRQPAPTGEPVLEVRGLSRLPKFEDITFTLRAGEVIGLAGLVGAGRTDVARSLFGLLPADRGEIRIHGKTVTIRSPEDAMGQGVALVPEDRQRQGALLPLSLWENATLSILPRLSPGGWLRNRAAQAIMERWRERLGVRCQDIEQPIGELSGGNQQKIVLAKWLETEPKVLILDEPTRGIDVRTKSEVHRLIAELAERGLAVLLISSDLPEVLTMSDRVLVMREGRIVREFGRDSATSEAIIAAASGFSYTSNATTPSPTREANA
jgi:rhamnose transport system ATP-binding protein